MAIETWGRLAPGNDNVLLLFTGLSPSAHARSSEEDQAPGWWEAMIGPGCALDTEKWHVVCINSLGSCFGSTGPASVNPATGERYRLSFPVLTVEDMAAAARRALAALGIDHVRAIVGPSMGGMVALAYALMFPGEVGALVIVSGAAQARAIAIAVRSLQREILRSDPAWRGGQYDVAAPPVDGMRLARKVGLISYRSLSEWDERFGRRLIDTPRPEPFGPVFEIEGYLDTRARSFLATFDANCYLYLSRSMDLFDAAEHGDGSVEAALARVEARDVLVVGAASDFLFPADQQRELAAGLRRAGRRVELEILSVNHGHDSFLIDTDGFTAVIRPFLNSL